MTKQMDEFISTCGAAFAAKKPSKPKIPNTPVKCGFCHKMYAGQRYLTRHMESKHKAKIIDLDTDVTDEEKENKSNKAEKDMKSLEHVHMFDVHGPESTSGDTEDTDSGADSGETSAEESRAKKGPFWCKKGPQHKGGIDNDPNYGMNINYKLRSALDEYENQLFNDEMQSKEFGLSLIDIGKNSSRRGFSNGHVCFHFFTPSNPEETNADEDDEDAGDPGEDNENEDSAKNSADESSNENVDDNEKERDNDSGPDHVDAANEDETDAEEEQENDIGPDDLVATSADEAEDKDEETTEEDKNNDADADDVDADIDYIKLYNSRRGFGFSTMDYAGDHKNPIVITRVEPGSPAAVGGLQPGDQIIAINGVYLCGFSDKNNTSSQISYVVMKRALECSSAWLTIRRKLREEQICWNIDTLDNFEDNEEEHKEVQNYAVYGDPVLMQNEDTEEEDIEESYYSSEEY